MDKKITAVSWLIERVEDVDLTPKMWENIKLQAKEMEDKRTEAAISFGIDIEFGNIERDFEKYPSSLQQFKETYGE